MPTGRECSRCVMDMSDPDIAFDAQGVCNHCRAFERDRSARAAVGDDGGERLGRAVQRIRARGAGRPYDCVIGVSGGVDSSFVALRAVELGLRPLAVHVDGGWNTELAVANIENLVKRLGIDLETVVIDWDEMRDLQLAFFRAGLSNCDIPQDHAFVAATWRTALRRDVRDILSGVNVATEYISARWGHTFGDLTHLRAVHARYGERTLRRYPTFSFPQMALWWPYFRGVRETRLLDLFPYVKADAKAVLIEKLGWRDYGGKHYESAFTKFYQAYYLPVKFGFDKRRIHLSNLILSGQMTREEALTELAAELYGARQLADDKAFVAKKLGISVSEFEQILASPPRRHEEFPTNTALVRRYQALTAAARRWLGRADPAAASRT